MKKIVTTVLLVLPLVFTSPRSYSQVRDSAGRYQRDEDDEDAPLQEKATRKQAAKPDMHAAFGIEGGINWSNLLFGPNGSGITTGPRIGALVDIPLAKWLSFRPGLAFVENGADNVVYINSAGQQVSGDHTWKISTLEIPLFLLFKTGRPGSGRFFFGAGFLVGYNLGGSVNPSDVNSGTLHIGSSNSDDIKALNISYGFTAGYALRSGLFFSLRTDFGISNLQPKSGPLYPYVTTIRSSDLLIQAGYVFGSKAKPKRRSHGDNDRPRTW